MSYRNDELSRISSASRWWPALLGASLLAACGASDGSRAGASFSADGGAAYPFGPNAPCDDRRLKTRRWAAEIVPGSNNGPPRQEAVELSFSSCTATVRLEAGVAVSGQVLNSTGSTAVPARLVLSRPSDIEGRPAVVTQVQTNDGGAFVLNLPARRHTLRVLPLGAQAEAEIPPLSLDLDVKPAMAALRIRFENGTELRGVVRDALGVAVAGVQVRAVDPSTGRQLSSVGTTDKTGQYLVMLAPEALAREVVRVVVTGASLPMTLRRDLTRALLPGLLNSLALRVPPLPDPQRFVLPLAGRSPSGAVTPVGGARVEVDALVWDGGENDTSASFAASGTTDGEGRAELLLIPGSDTNRSYRVRVEPPADGLFMRGLFNVQVGTKGGVLAPLQLELRASVVGRVTTSTGLPVRNAVVTTRPGASVNGGGPGDDAPFTPSQAVTASDGRFILRLERGTYGIDIVAPPAAALPRGSLEELVVDGDTDLRSVALPTAVTARIAVLGPSGEPAFASSVRLYSLDPAPMCPAPDPCPAVPRLRAESNTSEGGLFQAIVGAY